MDHRGQSLEMGCLSTGWLVWRMPLRIRWEMVGLWNDWKKEVSTLRILDSHCTQKNRIMGEGISESCDGDLHTNL